MRAKKTAQGIEVRKIPFPFPMEPFIIDAICQASEHITDPELQNEAKAWIGLESQHFMQHRRFNEVLIAR